MQDRIKILELLAQGKLTPEQADMLLEALAEKAESKTDGKVAWERAASELKSFGAQMSSVLSQSVTELRRGLETNLNNLSFGDHIASSTEREFGEEVRSLVLDSVNGRIRVERWAQPYIRLYVQADVRVDDQERAKEIVEQAIQVTQLDDEVSIRFLSRSDGVRINNGRLDVYIPDTLEKASLQTKNGAIFVDHANVRNIQLETLNGQIHVGYTRMESLHATTQNGGVQIVQSISDQTREIFAESKNGSLTLRGLSSQPPVRGQAKSALGVVSVTHPAYEVNYESELRKNACLFELKEADDAVEAVSVYLETKHGKITVQ